MAKQIKDLTLGEVITLPIDFIVVTLKLVGNERPFARMINDDLNLELNVVDEELKDLLGGEEDEIQEETSSS